jgi:hypothetical protein
MIRLSVPDFHAAAFWKSGVTIFALNRGREVGDLSITDPVDALNSARVEVASRVAAYIREPPSSNRRAAFALAIQELAAGAEAVRRGAARNPDWLDAFGPLHAAAVSFLARQSIALIRDRWTDVQRLGRTLSAEKSLSASMVGFLVNAKRPALAA